METEEIPGKKISVYLAKLFSFSEIPQNAVPFVTGNVRQLKAEYISSKWKAPVIYLPTKHRRTHELMH